MHVQQFTLSAFFSAESAIYVLEGLSGTMFCHVIFGFCLNQICSAHGNVSMGRAQFRAPIRSIQKRPMYNLSKADIL